MTDVRGEGDDGFAEALGEGGVSEVWGDGGQGDFIVRSAGRGSGAV